MAVPISPADFGWLVQDIADFHRFWSVYWLKFYPYSFVFWIQAFYDFDFLSADVRIPSLPHHMMASPPIHMALLWRISRKSPLHFLLFFLSFGIEHYFYFFGNLFDCFEAHFSFFCRKWYLDFLRNHFNCVKAHLFPSASLSRRENSSKLLDRPWVGQYLRFTYLFLEVLLLVLLVLLFFLNLVFRILRFFWELFFGFLYLSFTFIVS